MILGLQIIAVVFALFMIHFAYLHYRKGDINGMEILLWLLVWVGAIFIVIFPEIFRTFSRSIAISRAFDLAVLGGFMIAIPLIYKSYVTVKRLEKKVEDMARKDAISNMRRSVKSKNN